MSYRSSDNFEQAQILVEKLFGGPGGSKVFCFDENLTSERELRCWKSFGIHILLVLRLGLRHDLPKESMKVIEVNSEIPSAG